MYFGSMTPAERRKMLEDAEREYHPCYNGLHVCGQTPDDERPLTLKNVPGITPARFTELKAQFGLPADDDFDLVIDLMVKGDIIEDFCIRRQSLDALLRSV